MDNEFFIDGDHNGGIYNHFNHNSYSYCYQSPIMLVDPNGKQALPGFVGGAISEFLTILAGKYFDAKFDISFSDALGQFTSKDGWNILISAGIGAAGGGIAKIIDLVNDKRVQYIVGLLAETILETIDSMLKQYVETYDDKGKEIDYLGAFYSGLANAGGGEVLKLLGVKHSGFSEPMEQANKNIKELKGAIKETKKSTQGTVRSRGKKLKRQKKELSNERKNYWGNSIFEATGQGVNGVMQGLPGNFVHKDNVRKDKKKEKSNHPCQECNKK
jgi:hypothetical protein